MSTPLVRTSWNYPTSVRFGPGCITDLPAACSELEISAPLVVTDPGLSALPLVGDALARLRSAGMLPGLFDGVQGNPVGSNVNDAVSAYRSGHHDGVVALGGGSSLDVGKAVALVAGQSLPVWDFEDRDDWWLRADSDAIAPIVAVPTTSGTGSEVGRCSVILNEDEGRKVVIFHPKMMPGRVIADPELTVGLPPSMTAGVGMDALAHNLEAYCAPGFHPQADGIALEAMFLVHRSLERAVEDGSDLGARSDMMAAALMGATAFQKGLGAIHSLSHPVGAHLGSHHGLTNGVFMPYVMFFNRPAIEEHMKRLARTLNLEEPGFEGVLRWVLELRDRIGVPHTSRSLGFEPEMAEQFAPEALADPTAATNPLPLDLGSIRKMYLAAFQGDLA